VIEVTMMKLRTLCGHARGEFGRFVTDESGATAIEYAMIAVGVAVAVVGAVNSLGSQIKTTFYDKLASIMP
jgi:pilus assembly protein Flp/PilA